VEGARETTCEAHGDALTTGLRARRAAGGRLGAPLGKDAWAGIEGQDSWGGLEGQLAVSLRGSGLSLRGSGLWRPLGRSPPLGRSVNFFHDRRRT
jgi:hypothetical protein